MNIGDYWFAIYLIVWIAAWVGLCAVAWLDAMLRLQGRVSSIYSFDIPVERFTLKVNLSLEEVKYRLSEAMDGPNYFWLNLFSTSAKPYYGRWLRTDYFEIRRSAPRRSAVYAQGKIYPDLDQTAIHVTLKTPSFAVPITLLLVNPLVLLFPPFMCFLLASFFLAGLCQYRWVMEQAKTTKAFLAKTFGVGN